MVVCDEGHVIKNRKSTTSRAVNKISSRRRIILTGTPIQNNLKECKVPPLNFLIISGCCLLYCHVRFNRLQHGELYQTIIFGNGKRVCQSVRKSDQGRTAQRFEQSTNSTYETAFVCAAQKTIKICATS